MKSERKLSNGLHINIRGVGMPLLMIHGIISDSTFFEDSAEYLSKKYQVITYDRRGYGQSNRKQYTDYTVHTQAEDAVEVLRSTCQEPAWILGNSAGGLIGLEVSLHHPELVRGMIMIEPSLGYNSIDKEKLLAWNEELNSYVKENKIKRAVPAFSRVIGSVGGSEKTSSLQEMRKTYQNLSAFMYGELNEVQRYLPPIGQLKSLSMPVFIGVTERGRNSIFATSSETAAQMIGWPVVHFPGYHNVAKDMPLDFSLMLHGIISGLY